MGGPRRLATWFETPRRARLLTIEAGLGASGLPPLPKDRAAYPHMGGAEPDGGLVVGAHAHRQERETVAGGDLGGEREMRRGRLAERGDAHQPLDGEPVGLAAFAQEGSSRRGKDSRLLRLRAGIDLDEQPRMPA